MRRESAHTIKESILFEFYAKNIWPIHRTFAKKYLTPRCTRCAISAHASPLNSSGVCELCSETSSASPYELSPEMLAQLEGELTETLQSYQSRGVRDYDALVMISGGKDSTLLLHKLVTDYPQLRILTFTVDNSFMSPVALQNIDAVVQRFGLPHMLYRPNPRVYKTAFSYAFTHLRGSGCAQTVDTIDGEVFVDSGKHIAAQLKIPLLIVGFSFEQVDRYLHWTSYTNSEYDHTKRTAVGIYTPEELVNEEDVSVWWDPSRYDVQDIPRMICPFYVWRMNEVAIKKQIASLGLLTEKNTSPLVTNNALIPLCGLVDAFNLGYSSWEPEFSRMVREGKTDKALWQNIFELIEYSAKTGRFISKSVDTVLSELGLTRTDVGITLS